MSLLRRTPSGSHSLLASPGSSSGRSCKFNTIYQVVAINLPSLATPVAYAFSEARPFCGPYLVVSIPKPSAYRYLPSGPRVSHLHIPSSTSLIGSIYARKLRLPSRDTLTASTLMTICLMYSRRQRVSTGPAATPAPISAAHTLRADALLLEGVSPDCTFVVESTAAATELIVGLGSAPPAPSCASAATESVAKPTEGGWRNTFSARGIVSTLEDETGGEGAYQEDVPDDPQRERSYSRQTRRCSCCLSSPSRRTQSRPARQTTCASYSRSGARRAMSVEHAARPSWWG